MKKYSKKDHSRETTLVYASILIVIVAAAIAGSEVTGAYLSDLERSVGNAIGFGAGNGNGLVPPAGFTGAFFSDIETSVGNIIGWGVGNESFPVQDVLDLLIRDQDEPYGDGVTATWTASDMKPGASFDFFVPFVGLVTTPNSLPASHTEITTNYSVTEEEPCVSSDTDCNTDQDPDSMAKYVLISRCTYRQDGFCIDCLSGNRTTEYNTTSHTCTGNVTATNVNWTIVDANNDGGISFYDLKKEPIDNLPPVVNLPESQFEMGIKFSEDAGNEFQGDIFNMTMIFTLEQGGSQ